ncbi:hypothetical protein BJ875DRAFT_492363 [Amylocarpus encephaloides]|uniref:BTB domain-containing protein n=1 Tax=Amylocarpus encephaloides TaxID=45428 RepID=A0A9P8C9M0_9HELO|nr:hypothetical protein BJ875DRAFT_492363 [Amylocarpus encephaloides]
MTSIQVALQGKGRPENDYIKCGTDPQTPSTSTDIVVVPAPAPSLSDIMGCQVIRVIVGGNIGPEKSFTVHSNLLVSLGGHFEQKYIVHKDTGPMELPNDLPEVFAKLVNYVYAGTVPSVLATTPLQDQASALVKLCQFYATIEKWNLVEELLNKTMDSIQDSYHTFKDFPTLDLCKKVFTAVKKEESQLRKFCMASIVTNLKDRPLAKNDHFFTLLESNGAILREFVAAVSKFDHNQDIRVRDGNGDPNFLGGHVTIRGVSPCQFHVHKEVREDILVRCGTGEGREPREYPFSGLRPECYFYRYFA